MTLSFKRMYAIFEKDLKDLSKNMFVLTTLLMPLVFALMFSRSETVSIEIYFLVINMTFSAVGTFVQSAIIAEEKEKNTLRGLMMSPASTIDILAGKSLVSIVLTVVTMILCLFILDYEMTNPALTILAFGISLLFFIGLGTILGLLTRSLMEASVVIVPVIFVLGMGSIYYSFIQEYSALQFLEYLPNFQLEFLARELEGGAAARDIAEYLAVLSGWACAAVVLTIAVFRKRSIDE
ncbi:ABC transporter permease [Alteribacillus sp. HJP-4]|uniref:ABC transporter permease n=1 Tax=Alteribacillus sp. HJP-4 TaxID=2775394 RepID=UPI0035CCFCB9